MKISTLSRFPLVMAILLVSPGGERAVLAGTTPEGAGEGATASQLTEINKKITNPVSNIWSLAFQQNNYYLDDLGRWESNLQFQPLLPIALTREWNLITRPVIQVFNSIPYRTAGASADAGRGEKEIRRTTGLGDIILAEMLSPGTEIAGNWILGLGKVVKIGRLPLKIGLSGQYFPVRPDATGPEWDIQFAVTPVIPKLIQGSLWGE